jgi:hypothetical protein
MGLALVDYQRLTATAQQAAAYGATGDGCPDAMRAATRLLGRPVGSDDSCTVDVTGAPAVLILRLAGEPRAVPFFGTVRPIGEGRAITP